MYILSENIEPNKISKNYVADSLNSLIGSELIASLQYRIAAKTVKGTDYDSCASEFEIHADEEMEHMKILMEESVKRELPVCQDLLELIKCSTPVYEFMSSTDSTYLVNFHLDSEEKAITAYTHFYESIKDFDAILADRIKEIIDDEMEHRKDLKKILSSIDGSL